MLLLLRSRSALLAAFLFFSIVIHAQSIKDASVEYDIVKPPLIALPANIKHYQSQIVPSFTEKNAKLIDAYNEEVKVAKHEYDSAMIEYTKDLKIAEDKYAADMEEYKKKSLGKKVVEKTLLNENTKPVKHLPYKPYLRTVPKPTLQTEYDWPTLASSYIKLDSYENAPDNAVKIIVTCYGFDYTQPRVMNNQKDMMSFGTGQKTSTYTQTNYYLEYSYRHPMAVKVVLPDGKEIENITPQQLNVYKIIRSPESTTSPSANTELLVKSTEAKALQENLTYVNKIINEKFGNFRTKRTATLYYVKDKNEEYTDLTTAFNESSSALKYLADDSAAAKPNIQHAIGLLEKALSESDLQDKKARIDKDVTIAICFNLLELHLALKEHAAGMAIFQKMNAISLSNKERMIKNQYDADYIDLKKRLTVKN